MIQALHNNASTMTASERSVFLFGFYLAALGITLLLAPEALFSAFNQSPPLNLGYAY